MEVRKATQEDLAVLVEFTAREAEASEGQAKDRALLEKGVRAALQDASIAMYWLLVDGANRPVGNISALKEWSDWHAGYYWWIQSMYLVPEQRGQGHMSLLLEAVETEMQRQGGLELRLYVNRRNARAIRAYEKTGFVNAPYQIMVKENKELGSGPN